MDSSASYYTFHTQYVFFLFLLVTAKYAQKIQTFSDPELADAAQKCKVDLTFTDFRDMEQRIEFIKRYVKQSKSPTVDELVDILEVSNYTL
ncbi:hypothetical protein TOT_040000731 [Theileria orientalis strain Shintoku]|uniref:Uncharacterized protein n=1 Tax=Theileria orientalis strain Shintoku TaxID=869250 RepID=J7MF15_THEOR|nr:hypothetical protein TOT_040000731 [Theileria orientalis strain Shintoku]BAM42364.1 hypothetical protein TOT_040000731 [Theileria orientalis strain Shintoku]|eukprot:XP_009692665.1 hypothetical protein TOT_040000731 [Theileria orientalis strain Shintoku]